MACQGALLADLPRRSLGEDGSPLGREKTGAKQNPVPLFLGPLGRRPFDPAYAFYSFGGQASSLGAIAT